MKTREIEKMNLLIPNEIIIIKNHLKDNEIDDGVFFQKRELEISISFNSPKTNGFTMIQFSKR